MVNWQHKGFSWAYRLFETPLCIVVVQFGGMARTQHISARIQLAEIGNTSRPQRQIYRPKQHFKSDEQREKTEDQLMRPKFLGGQCFALPRNCSRRHHGRECPGLSSLAAKDCLSQLRGYGASLGGIASASSSHAR